MTGGKKTKAKVTVSDGTTEATSSTCVFCLRTIDKMITASNVSAELNLGVIKSKPGPAGILTGLRSLLSSVLLPAINSQENWGKTSPDHAFVQQFRDAMMKFSGALGDAEVAISDVFTFKVLEAKAGRRHSLEACTTPALCAEAARDPDFVADLEALMKVCLFVCIADAWTIGFSGSCHPNPLVCLVSVCVARLLGCGERVRVYSACCDGFIQVAVACFIWTGLSLSPRTGLSLSLRTGLCLSPTNHRCLAPSLPLFLTCVLPLPHLRPDVRR